MQQNVGALDSTIRIGLAFGLMFAGFLLKPPASGIAFAFFLVLAVSGFAGKCPLYSLLGVTTCPED
jgi:hypothetical protein